MNQRPPKSALVLSIFQEELSDQIVLSERRGDLTRTSDS